MITSYLLAFKENVFKGDLKLEALRQKKASSPLVAQKQIIEIASFNSQ